VPSRLLALLAVLSLAAVAAAPAAGPSAAPAPAGAAAAMDALTILPPGNSMRYTVDGQARGTLTGDPGDFGDHVDDQREMYWDYEFKDGRFREECEDPVVLRPGARYCLDGFGVPAVYGDTDADVWYAAGYAVAQLRLFLLDAVRRTARGTLAELTGPGGVPADVEARVLGYTDAELDGFYERLSTASRTALDSYVDGVNDYISDVVVGPRMDELPAEYALLTAVPEPIDHRDVLAAGVLMTRTVASEGGTEMENVAALRALEEEFGTERGRAIFEDLVWVEDGEATVTVPREEGVFPRTTADEAERAAAFQAMADLASEVPLELATGPGTGDAPPPVPVVDDLTRLGGGTAGATAGAAASSRAVGAADLAAANPIVQAQAALEEWRAALDGGSFLAVIAPERTADGSALLVSEPQLGYDPTLLVELEVHGGGYTARGVTVPGLPVVGIGYTDRVAWALTTGNAKTIDSFIEETRRTDDGTLEYRHDGAWKPAECRTESVGYRLAAEGVPAGPDVFSHEVEVCRTVHGPIVAMTEDETAARSVQYHMWLRETDTVEGVLAWNRAQDLEDFEAAMRQVTWNENTGYVDADGRIAFWHPGLHRVRDPRTDLRLPAPGTGEYDLGDHLPFESLPHAIDPAQGYLANWNNKPAHGWLDGVGMSSTSYPAGRGQRVTNVIDAIEARHDWTFEALRDLDRYAAEHDMRATEFLPLLLGLREQDGLTELQQAALDLLAGWDGSANGPGADMEFEPGSSATVGAANTVFEAVLDALVDDLLSPVALETYDLVERQRSLGRHVYDVSPALNLVLRVLDPSASTLTPSEDYLRGRTAAEALLDALTAALDGLGVEEAGELDDLRREYRMERVCSPTGVVGPCLEMPFLERGTWIHLTGFDVATDEDPDGPGRGKGHGHGPPTGTPGRPDGTPGRPDGTPGRPDGTPGRPDGSPGRPDSPDRAHAAAGLPDIQPAAIAAAIPSTGGGALGVGLLALAGAALLRRST
jgi:penicillin G amidase